MTEEQFKRACEIKDRLNALNEVKHDVFDAKESNLVYAYKNCCDKDEIHPRYTLRAIAETLDKHDKMIREEIDEEIRKLQEELKCYEQQKYRNFKLGIR